MKQVVSIGNQNFRSLRERNCFYVDKTSFIKEWWESFDDVTLITRSRRFGKTLNLSMVESFFLINMKVEQTYLKGFLFGKKKNIETCKELILLSF